MKEFPILDAADQQFGTILNNRRVTIRVRYNPTTDLWSFDLAIDDLPVLHGRRIVTGVDLLAPFNLDIGLIFALTTPGNEALGPDRASLPAGTVKLYHATEVEVAAL